MRRRWRMAGSVVFLVIPAVFAVMFAANSLAQQKPAAKREALLAAVAKSKVTIAQAIQKATQGEATPIAAKFDLHADGTLTIDVFVAEQGLEMDAAHNSFKEVKCSPESESEAPHAEPITQPNRIARVAEQLTIMRLSNKSLLEIEELAQKTAFGSNGGTVVSIRPDLERRQGYFEVQVTRGGRLAKLHFDLHGKFISNPRAGEEDEND